MFPTPAPTFCDGNTTQLTPKLPEHFCFRDTADQIDYFTTRVKACKAACLNYADYVGIPTLRRDAMRSTASAMAEEKLDEKYSKREGAAAKAVLIFCSPPGSPESKVGAGYENQPFDLNHHDELTRVDHPPNSFAFRGSERRLSDPWTPGKSGGAGSLAWRTSGKNITHATSTLEGTPTPQWKKSGDLPPHGGKDLQLPASFWWEFGSHEQHPERYGFQVNEIELKYNRSQISNPKTIDVKLTDDAVAEAEHSINMKVGLETRSPADEMMDMPTYPTQWENTKTIWTKFVTKMDICTYRDCTECDRNECPEDTKWKCSDRICDNIAEYLTDALMTLARACRETDSSTVCQEYRSKLVSTSQELWGPPTSTTNHAGAGGGRRWWRPARTASAFRVVGRAPSRRSPKFLRGRDQL
jgi:hypothetical protein